MTHGSDLSISFGVETENVLFLEMGISEICVSGNNSLYHVICVGLSQDLKTRPAIDCGIAHGKQIPHQFEPGVEELPNLVDSLVNLNDAVQLKIAR